MSARTVVSLSGIDVDSLVPHDQSNEDDPTSGQSHSSNPAADTSSDSGTDSNGRTTQPATADPQVRSNVEDLVQFATTSNGELADAWELNEGKDAFQHLNTELDEYYERIQITRYDQHQKHTTSSRIKTPLLSTRANPRARRLNMSSMSNVLPALGQCKRIDWTTPRVSKYQRCFGERPSRPNSVIDQQDRLRLNCLGCLEDSFNVPAFLI